MTQNSKIEWTDHTMNPWWGCQRVSPGCEHCYAEAFAKRTGHDVWGPTSGRRFFGEKHWAEPIKWNEAAERDGARRRVFCASMADVFEIPRDGGLALKLGVERGRLWPLIERTRALDWLLLTKRPENVMPLVPNSWLNGFPSNVWIGTTVEDQQRANERIPELRKIHARVRFLSCEPLLEEVTLNLPPDPDPLEPDDFRYWSAKDSRIHWVIVGGESGGGARRFNLAWANSLVEQCKRANVAVFVKQLGMRPEFSIPDRPITRLRLADRKGGDWNEWPAELRLRELPR